MLIRINKLLEQFPFYLLLLPVFFVVHNYMQYYGLLTFPTALKIFVQIEIICIICFLVLKVCIGNANRSALIVSLVVSVDLFFGVIKDFFKTFPGFHFMSRYTVLLLLTLLTCFFAVKIIIRKKDFTRTNRFLNILLILFLLAEGIVLFQKGTGIFMQQNKMVENNLIKTDSLPANPVKPDVWFLVFDSYPGSSFLNEYLHYDNAGLDSTLQKKGFYIASRSRSNYNKTAFSIASTMNFEFLKNIHDHSNLELSQYNQASFSIAHAAVPDIFIHYGYELYNLSIFDITGHPSMFRENFLVLPEEKMLLYNTLTESVNRDIGWNFYRLLRTGMGMTQKEKQDLQRVFTEANIKKRNFNNRLIDSLQKIAEQNTVKPKFVYAHFYLPHPPFFYDSAGHTLTLDFSMVSQSMEQKSAFLSYLNYTNKVIIKMVDAVLHNSGRSPVIIVQSDHGYRDFKTDLVPQTEYFRNYSAFYFTDKDYSSIYDSITNINTFPVIFNKYFHTNIPMQKDTTTYLRY